MGGRGRNLKPEELFHVFEIFKMFAECRLDAGSLGFWGEYLCENGKGYLLSVIVFQSFRFKHAIFYDTTFSDFTWLWIVLLDGSNVVRTSLKSMGLPAELF